MGSPVAYLGMMLGLLVLAVLIIGVLAWRRLRELRVGGIDVALRATKNGKRHGWNLGVAHYRGEEFAWYRILSLRSGPNWVINRHIVEIAQRREPTGTEAYAMPAGSTVLNLTGPDLELAMNTDALTGFLSWLESAPPGHSMPWAS